MDKLEDFLNNPESSKALVCIDWANVFNWEKLKRDGVTKKKEKVSPKGLYDYLEKNSKIIEKKIYFGLEKANVAVMDNIVRWVNLKNKKEVKNLQELIDDIKSIETSEAISPDLKKQIKEVFNQYRSSKIIEEFRSIGFDVSSKDVKIFKNSLNDLPKFHHVVQGLEKTVDSIEKNLEKNIKLPGIGGEEEINLLRKQKEKINRICRKKIKNRKCDFDVDITIDIVRNIDNFDTIIIFSGDGDYAPAVKYFLDNNKRVAIVSIQNKLGREFNKIIAPGKFIKVFADNIDDIWCLQSEERGGLTGGSGYNSM